MMCRLVLVWDPFFSRLLASFFLGGFMVFGGLRWGVGVYVVGRLLMREIRDL